MRRKNTRPLSVFMLVPILLAFSGFGLAGDMPAAPSPSFYVDDTPLPSPTPADDNLSNGAIAVPDETLDITAAASGIIADGLYSLRSVRSNLYLVVPNSATGNVVPCRQYRFNGRTNQVWDVKHLGDNVYTLRPLHSKGSALDVKDGSAAQYAQVGIWTASTSSPQASVQWKIALNWDGSYRLLSRASNYQMALTVLNASTAEGEQCIQHTFNGTGNDQWVFEPAFEEGVDFMLSPSTDKYPGMWSMSFNVKIAGNNKSDALEAMNAWNQKTGSGIVENSSAVNSINIGTYSDMAENVYGRYTSVKENGRATNCTIKINELNLNNYLDGRYPVLTSAQRTTAFRNVIAHELGHALGLLDEPIGASSIMKYSYVMWNGYHPEKADVFGVKSYYSR